MLYNGQKIKTHKRNTRLKHVFFLKYVIDTRQLFFQYYSFAFNKLGPQTNKQKAI